MRPSNRRNDGKPQAGTAAIGVAGFVEPPEPTKDEFSIFGGDTGTVVVDVDPGVAVGRGDLDPNFVFGMTAGIGHQVAHSARDQSLVEGRRR